MSKTITRSGEQFAHCNGIDLCYETFGSPEDPPLLLIMGLSQQMLLWEDDFCELLANRGHWVIRFDNRDAGRSTVLHDAPVPKPLQMLSGKSAPYALADLADDSVALLDCLEIKDAHIVGMSMGGMVAQLVAINHPEKVRSLVSIMSTTGNRWVGQPTPRQMLALFRKRPRDRAEWIADFIKTWEQIGSRVYPPDPEVSAKLGELAWERGVHPAGPARQLAAITSALDRTKQLRQLRVPTTVIHGTKDPLVRPSGGKATAAAIPGARLEMVPEMGHHLPRQLWTRILDLIVARTQATQGAPA
ncbi:MAG: alpha/beta fold hydrolase [Solirubrobacterales bacterium]|nr:alpha/beta fold hydrolase [Solirubrobacterales bacterium]